MRADIAWWNLRRSAQSIDSLRDHLRGGAVEPWHDVPGLLLKVWIADREHNRWGAVMLWEVDRPLDHPLPPNQAARLIGYQPTHRIRFDVEATVGLGPALRPGGRHA